MTKADGALTPRQVFNRRKYMRESFESALERVIERERDWEALSPSERTKHPAPYPEPLAVVLERALSELREAA